MSRIRIGLALGVSIALVVTASWTDLRAQTRSSGPGTGCATPPSAAPQPIGLLTIGNATASIYAFSFGATNSGSLATGGGAGAGKATLQDVSVTKFADALSVTLFNDLVRGVHLPAVQVDVFQPGTTSVASTYLLQDVLVSAYSASGSSEAAAESASFNFARITVTSGGTSFCWSVTLNASCGS